MRFKILLCFLLLVVVPPIPGQAPQRGTDGSKKPEGQAGGQQHPAGQIKPSVVVNPKDSQTKQGSGTQHKKDDDQVSITTVKPLDVRADIPKDWMDKANWYMTFGLVLIGGFGVCLAVRTLRAIERQAALMETQFDQWVELTNWGAQKPRNDRIRITVDLINPSAFPLTVSGEITIGDERREFDKTFLSPNRPTMIEINVGVAILEQPTWSESFPVSAIFTHSHKIRGLPIRQKLAGRIDCVYWKNVTKWVATFTPSIDMNPETQKPQQAN